MTRGAEGVGFMNFTERPSFACVTVSGDVRSSNEEKEEGPPVLCEWPRVLRQMDGNMVTSQGPNC